MEGINQVRICVCIQLQIIRPYPNAVAYSQVFAGNFKFSSTLSDFQAVAIHVDILLERDLPSVVCGRCHLFHSRTSAVTVAALMRRADHRVVGHYSYLEINCARKMYNAAKPCLASFGLTCA